jgi:hypothetical protein
MIKYLLLLIPLLSFGQIDFFKYSTIYTSMNVNTSMVENQDYISIDKGYEDVTQVNPYDYNLTIGIRKIARMDYEKKLTTWYYGTEKSVSDNVTIGNSVGFEYLFNYSFIRNRGDSFVEQNYWLRYLGKRFVVKAQYTDMQRVDLRYNSADARLRWTRGNFDFTLGGVFRVHDPYGITPIDDFWVAGEQSFPQLAEQFGYSSQFVNGQWHWFKNEELLATSNDEFYKHYFGEAIADFNARELEALGMQKQLSLVIGLAYYKYTPKYWAHLWANLMPYHRGLDDFSYEYGESGLERLEWDSGAILGLRVTNHLGLFVEGTHLKYWEKPVYECKFGFNYLIF